MQRQLREDRYGGRMGPSDAGSRAHPEVPRGRAAADPRGRARSATRSGCSPASMIEHDPLYASAFFANLASHRHGRRATTTSTSTGASASSRVIGRPGPRPRLPHQRARPAPHHDPPLDLRRALRGRPGRRLRPQALQADPRGPPGDGPPGPFDGLNPSPALAGTGNPHGARAVPRRLPTRPVRWSGCRGPRRGWGESRVSFFRDRLEAFPRLADYRLAKEAGYWPYYKTVESASRPRFTIEGNDYINFGSNNYLSLSYHPEGDRGRPGGHPAVRHRRHRLPAPERHPRPPPHLEAELADVLRAGGGAGVLHRLRRQRQHHQRPPQPSRLRRPRQGRPQLAAHRRAALGRHDEAVRAQRPRPPRQDPRRAAGRAGQGRHRRRRLLHGRRHRAARRDGRAVPSVPQHVPARRRGPRPRRARRARSRCGRAVRRARRRRPRHHHVLEDARLVRRRAHRLRRRHRAAHPRRRPAHLHRVEHAGFAWPPRSRRSASCADDARDDRAGCATTSTGSSACSPSAACR